MAYEKSTDYLDLYDAAQSPSYLAALASRLGVQAPGAGQAAALERPLRYLELGCGAGHALLSLAPLHPGVEFVGIDFNASHVAKASSTVSRLGLDTLQFHCADFRALPDTIEPADFLVVRGVYPWLQEGVRGALEVALQRLSRPGALLKLHYLVTPGATARHSLGQLLQHVLPPASSPRQGRELVRLLQQDAPHYSALLPALKPVMQRMLEAPDALWAHDYLNPDYRIEPAHAVIERLADRGFEWLGSARHDQNLSDAALAESVRRAAGGLPIARAQTLLDHVLARAWRDDLFVRGPCQRKTPAFPAGLRLGLIAPVPADTQAPVPAADAAPNQVRQQVVQALQISPRSLADLQAAVAAPAQAVAGALDRLLAERLAGPFLGPKAAAQVDRERVRRINRERLAESTASLSPQTRTALLGAEYGSCLTLGWFESLLLHHFPHHEDPATERQMLTQIHAAKLRFAENGMVAENQLKSLRNRVRQVHNGAVRLITYAGADI